MDVDMRLIEALGGHHGHHLQNPVSPTQSESNKISEFASAVSELTNLLRSNGQVPQGSDISSYPNGHLSQDHSNGPQTSQFSASVQLELHDHALLQSLALGEESLQELLESTLGVTQENLQNEVQTQANTHPRDSESSGIGRNSSHDEELAEMQRAIAELSQPATRANSPPRSIDGPGSLSEYSETSPAGRADGLAREESQSMSPIPYRSNSQALGMSPIMDLVPASQWGNRNSIGPARNSVGSSSKARQDDPFEDPAKAAERERVRGENRVRKKRWRESNQDRNKDNDLRCRVTKRGNKLWGPEDSEEKRTWLKIEFSRRRAKREAKERARATDETGSNVGAGSSSVFQAYNSSPPPPMSAINTSPIMNDFQPPFPDNHADETRAALQNLVSLLHPPNTTLQNPQVIKPQGVQSDPHNNGRGQPGGGFHGQELGFHQPIDIQKIVAEAESDRERYKALQEAGWSASQQSSHGYYDSSQINDMVTSLPVRLNSIANEDPPKPLEPRLLPWPGPNGNENGLLGTVRSKSESPEVRSEALRSSQQPQDQVQVQHAESVVEKLSDADIDGLFPMNKHGEPDLNDEALERLIAESGLCMDELLSGAMEPEGPTGTVSEASRPSVTQSEHSDIGGLVSDGTEESMSLEQINALIGDLTESMDLDESVNTCSPHSANLISHDQAVDLTPDTIAVLTNNWRNRQYSATPSSDTISCGTKRSSPDDSSSFSKRICKPPPFQNPIALTQQLQAILQSSSSSDHGQSSASRHQLGSSYAASFGNSDNMNKRLMKPPPYRPVSKPPTIGITNGLGSAAAASRAKSNEHEKKIKSMGFPPLMAGMKPK